MCELCDNIQDKDKREKIMAKKVFILHMECIDVFHDKCYITTIEKLSFHLSNINILGSMECGTTRNDFFMIMHKKII